MRRVFQSLRPSNAMWFGTLFAPIVTGALATGGGQSDAAPLTGHNQQLICKIEHGGSEADPMSQDLDFGTRNRQNPRYFLMRTHGRTATPLLQLSPRMVRWVIFYAAHASCFQVYPVDPEKCQSCPNRPLPNNLIFNADCLGRNQLPNI